MNKFKIKPYSVGELAQLYCPDRDYYSAMRLFHKDLSETRGLQRALQKAGYKEGDRLLTRGQVQVIVQYLGEP